MSHQSPAAQQAALHPCLTHANLAHVRGPLWLAAGNSFSIADISAMPYMRMVMTKAGEADLVARFPNVQVPLAAGATIQSSQQCSVTLSCCRSCHSVFPTKHCDAGIVRHRCAQQQLHLKQVSCSRSRLLLTVAQAWAERIFSRKSWKTVEERGQLPA